MTTFPSFLVAILQLFAGADAPQAPNASLSVVSHKTDGRLGLTFTLVNRGASPLWVNRRMAVEEESSRPQVGEIRLRVVDQRGRIVPFACSQRALGAQDSDYGILLPGEQATSKFNDLGDCLFLEPGETLTVFARYFDANPAAPAPRKESVPLKARIDADPVKVRVPGRRHSTKPDGN